MICDGPFIPMITIGEGTIIFLKTIKEYDDADRKTIEKNFRAKKILSAKEKWEALQTAHEGIAQVKQSKIDMLTAEYELFKINEDEVIQDMHIHFTTIINELHSQRLSSSQR
ncbi:uncharacterized protein [Nicotiana tomentosiformis]|uniref:uncharacterized protein n=1 Tax=Nicotiana tomentosiformis TaxID=4098 RepID=UPI00144505C1|nr:uncharacterized protein LOC117273661 [Nicotiana tomentosiformis]